MIDGVLYVTTPYNSVAARRCRDRQGDCGGSTARPYELGQLLSGERVEAARDRVLARRRPAARLPQQPASPLLARSADGKPVPLVRQRRRGSLTDGLPRISDITHATQSSPPVVYRDLVIVGSQVPDRVQLPDPMGYVQAFDARTGKRVWAFSVIPQSAKDPGADTWENESWRKNGHAQRLGADGAGRGARPAVPADLDAEQRLLRRRAARRQPVCRIARLSRRGHGQDEVAFSDGPSRTLGLRQPRRSQTW